MERKLLAFCTLCRNKSDAEIAQLPCHLVHTVKRYGKGDYLAYQGDVIKHLLILSEGSVYTQMSTDSGLSISIDQLTAPYPLAAAFIFADDNHFPVDVIALQDCEVLLVPKEAVEKQMTQCVGFLRGFLAFNANRVRFLSERLKLFSQRSIKAKIACYILERDHNGRFSFENNITTIASYLGVERPSLSRVLSQMIQEGLIQYKDREGKILDYEKMKEIL